MDVRTLNISFWVTGWWYCRLCETFQPKNTCKFSLKTPSFVRLIKPDFRNAYWFLVFLYLKIFKAAISDDTAVPKFAVSLSEA